MDLSKCFGRGCLIKERCLRFTIPNKNRQHYIMEPHERGGTYCKEFVDNGHVPEIYEDEILTNERKKRGQDVRSTESDQSAVLGSGAGSDYGCDSGNGNDSYSSSDSDSSSDSGGGGYDGGGGSFGGAGSTEDF